MDIASAEDGNGKPFLLDDTNPLIELEVEPGVFVVEGLGYKEVMEDSTNVSDDLDDFLAELDALIATGSPGVTPTTTLDAAIDQVLAARTRATALVSQIETVKIASEAKLAAIDTARGGLLGTDLAEAATKLTRVQTLLEAARSIFSRLESSNLFQRLL